jgi:hypothetical protein
MLLAYKGRNTQAYFARNIIDREKKYYRIELAESSRPIKGEALWLILPDTL